MQNLAVIELNFSGGNKINLVSAFPPAGIFCGMSFWMRTDKAWNIVLLLLRIWLGYRMFTASYSSVIGMLTSSQERAFFKEWFGNDLHFPFPLAMAFLAKSSELLGGILVCVGLLTRPGAFLIAFTMFIATITANLGKDWNLDGGFTVSYCLFAIVLLVWGAGKFSLDHIVFHRRSLRSSWFI